MTYKVKWETFSMTEQAAARGLTAVEFTIFELLDYKLMNCVSY